MAYILENIHWKKFVNNVMWLRNYYQFSEDKMAEIMGINIDLLREVEKGNGKDALSVEVVYKICGFFNVSPDKLFGDLFGVLE